MATSPQKMYEIILAAHLEVVEDRPERWEDVIDTWIRKAEHELSPQTILYLMSKVSDEFRHNSKLDRVLMSKFDSYQKSQGL